MINYTKEFNRVADVVRYSDDAAPIRYGVLVGRPDYDFTFLDADKFISEDFSTQRDAQNAFNLARRTLEIIDEQITDESHAPIPANLRRELIKAADKAVERAIDAGIDDLDANSLYAVVATEVACELNSTFLKFFNRR